MEYIYAGMLIHKVGGKIDEATVTKVIEAAGGKPDPAKVKVLVAAFDGVDIDKIIKEASMMQMAPAPSHSEGGHKEEKKEVKQEQKKEDKKSEEQAAAGLGALFG